MRSEIDVRYNFRISYLEILNHFTNLIILRNRGIIFLDNFIYHIFIRNSRYFYARYTRECSNVWVLWIKIWDHYDLSTRYLALYKDVQTANECFENKRERDCRVFFFQIKCLFANAPLCIIGICSWRDDGRSYLREKKKKKNVN